MERLLDMADALVAATPDGQPDPPDFELPEEYASVDPCRHMQIRENSGGGVGGVGRGWFAARDIPAGTLLMVSKPIGMVMDWEDDSGDQQPQPQVADDDDDDRMDDGEEEEETDKPAEDETEGRMNELLYLELLRKLKEKPALWADCVSQLYPRTENEIKSLPSPWIITDDELFMEVEIAISQLQQVPEFSQQVVSEIVRRLPLIIRYNVLSVETCSELLSYPSRGHACLAGVGLYHLPSYFNHSDTPNVSRWAVGDVMGFVANADIPAGAECRISYVEHDVLCESASRRNAMLNMDFAVSDDSSEMNISTKAGSSGIKDGPTLPVVDSDVQNELMAMDPFGRLDAIDELMQQALGLKGPDEEEAASPHWESLGGSSERGGAAEGTTATAATVDMAVIKEEKKPVKWFQCDVQNLRILRAITLDGMGQSKDALKLWEESADFVDRNLPPLDENSIVLRVQAALCAFHVGEIDRAKRHAHAALQTHVMLFGGDVQRFRRRFRDDLALKIRPDHGGSGITATETPAAAAAGTTAANSVADILWPIGAIP